MMLKSSRTWPSILTMAVVQLKFDQRGKYSYSTIANINQSPLIESPISFPNGGLGDETTQCPLNGANKKDLITKKNVKTRTVTAINCRHTNQNGNSLNGATSPSQMNGKVCLCELKFCDKRSRSESIKVDNWDYIYREKSFRVNREQPLDDLNIIAKSPQNCDHGYLSGLGAQKLQTIQLHYYPESGFGWIVLFVAVLTAIITHGFQLSAVFFLLPLEKRFKVNDVDCLGE